MQYKTIDLFAGAGGLSLGFKMTGRFVIVAAAEINKNAQATYMKNIPTNGQSFEMIDNVIGYDFSELNKQVGGIDIVIGGPPCQGFSNANRQKNHLINMNNALVKEYFRAVREISPKAFVMENVKMLSSEKHRFFESEFDNDQIIELRNAGASIPLKKECLYIAPSGLDELMIEDTINPNWRQLALPSRLVDLIRVLDKNLKNPRRLPTFIDKHGKEIIKQIDIILEENDDIEYLEKLITIRDGVEKGDLQTITADVSYLATLQKALQSMEELNENKIIGKYGKDAKDNLVFETNSYSVIDYVNAVLGDSYVQVGGVLNAKWFEVPQDRKRHIIIGVRKDIAKTKEIKLPDEPTTYSLVSVKDAIGDLAIYPTGTAKDYEPLPYKNEEKLSDYEMLMRTGSKTVKNHIITASRPIALERFAAIKQGENFHSLDEKLKDTYSKPERTQNTIYLRLDPDSPSGTVVNVRKSMWIHPELNRAISVREAARLQSFPDTFEFVGTKDSQYQQVGNAVPPLLSKAIAELLKIYL